LRHCAWSILWLLGIRQTYPIRWLLKTYPLDPPNRNVQCVDLLGNFSHTIVSTFGLSDQMCLNRGSIHFAVSRLYFYCDLYLSRSIAISISLSMRRIIAY
jgi:hypothetical protein